MLDNARMPSLRDKIQLQHEAQAMAKIATIDEEEIDEEEEDDAVMKPKRRRKKVEKLGRIKRKK